MHLGFPDPAAAVGSKEGQLEEFRQVRDGLQQEILTYLEQVERTSTEMEVEFYATGNL